MTRLPEPPRSGRRWLRWMLLTLLALAAPARGAQGGDAVVATWEGGRITRAELADWWAAERTPDDHADPAEASQPGQPDQLDQPGEDDVRDLAFQEILARDAEASGRAATLRVRFHLETVRQVILIPALRDRIVADVSVSDEEVEAVRREHPEAFRRPRKLKLRNIYRTFGSATSPEALREHLDELRAQLVAGADFADAARRESESQSAARGGALGFVDPDDLPAPVARAVRELAPGEISRPVEHGEGISLFRCDEVDEAAVPTPDEVREKIRDRLLRERGHEAWNAYLDALLAEADPKIRPKVPESPEAPESDHAVLEMQGYTLDAEAVEELVAFRWPRAPGAPPRDPDRTSERLRSWAGDVLLERRATDLGLDEEPEVASRLRWRRMRILAQTELARLLDAEAPRPTEDDLRADFAASVERYRDLASIRLAAIWFGKAGEGEAGRTQIEEARAVAARIADGAISFDEAARRYSRHPSAEGGGDLGWQPEREVAMRGPTASHAIRALAIGESTGLLHLDTGLWIFRVEGRRDARPLSFEEVEPRLRKEWVERRLPEVAVEIRRRRLEKAGFELAGDAGGSAAAKPRVVRWSTATEVESYGYDVYRATDPEGPFERITEEPVPGAGTTDVPQSYVYEDRTAEPGIVYYYYVESISTSGQRRQLSPVGVSRGDG